MSVNPKKKLRVWKFILLPLAMALFLAGYLLFHGYFDQGHFEIQQVEWSPSKQVAVLARRRDDQALGGLTYFVLIDNHPLTTEEIRHAYHSKAVVFAAMSDRLSLQWNGSNRLAITCAGPFLEQQYIDVEKQRSGDLAIVYNNISPQTAQTYRPK